VVTATKRRNKGDHFKIAKAKASKCFHPIDFARHCHGIRHRFDGQIGSAAWWVECLDQIVLKPWSQAAAENLLQLHRALLQ
jgi:hypothetical protein